MAILKLTTAALAAATALGVSGAAMAAPAVNLGNGQHTAKTDDAVKQARYWRHHNHGYYYSRNYYRPYYRPYYAPYYYGSRSFNFGAQIR